MEVDKEWSDELEWRKKQKLDGRRGIKKRKKDGGIIKKQDREVEEGRKIGKEDRREKIAPKSFIS